MDRNGLIAEMDRQIEHVSGSSNRHLKVVRETLAVLSAIRDGLRDEHYGKAVDSAKELKCLTERQGGIVMGAKRAGVLGPGDITIYASETIERNHQYVLLVLSRVEDAALAAGHTLTSAD